MQKNNWYKAMLKQETDATNELDKQHFEVENEPNKSTDDLGFSLNFL